MTEINVFDEAIAAAFNFEAVKAAYRQTKEGIAVTLVIHPHSVPPALATAPLGVRYQVAMVEVGDDDLPVSRDPAHLPQPESRPRQTSVPQGTAGGANLSRVGKERYGSSSEMKRACARSGILAQNEEFWAWADKQTNFIRVHDEGTAAEFIRQWIAGRRRNIAFDASIYLAFRRLEEKFGEAVGRRAEMRG